MNRLRIKLLIDGGAKRVVFAEAEKEFVDFLFHILSLPIADVFGLVGKDAKFGSLSNLHVSIDNMKDYLQSKTYINPFVNPAADFWSAALSSAAYGRRSVKGMVTYMVMDDLTVAPMSFAGLKKLNVKSVDDLEELTVFFGKDEAILLLRASLHSKNVLTDVFLKTSIMKTSKITSDCGTSGVKIETEGVRVKRERTS